MRSLVCVLAMAALVGCAKKEAPVEAPAAAPPAESTPPTLETQSTTQLGSASGSAVTGELTFVPEQGAVRIAGVVRGLEPDSEHGFHIHEKGDCSAPDASSAGGHFNPGAAQHGGPTSASKHAGDMTNISADASGVANIDVLATGVTLGAGGEADILNKALVVHAKPDDYQSQPAGAAGERIACGVIQ